MPTLSEGWDRINRSYPVNGPATCLVEVVLYKWIFHSECLMEASASIFIDTVTMRKRVENVRFS